MRERPGRDQAETIGGNEAPALPPGLIGQLEAISRQVDDDPIRVGKEEGALRRGARHVDDQARPPLVPRQPRVASPAPASLPQ